MIKFLIFINNNYFLTSYMKNKLITHLKENWKSWLTVAIINIPLSISLAVASWATPIQWIITWIWAWIIASVFASSQYNIFWVAWALSSILFTFVLSNWENWVVLLPLLAICSWIIMYIVYLLKITKYITLIPSTVLHWFLISVWVTIALWQLSWSLWLNALPKEEHIYMTVYQIFVHIKETDIPSFVLFLSWFSFLLILKKFKPAFPWVIILTILWIIFWKLASSEFPTILLLSQKFKDISFELFQNPFSIWEIKDKVELFSTLFTTSLIIAIIAILETIISAKIAEKITKVKFNKDKEVLWLALSNIWSWLFWWLPATAVFIRTALNIKSWATHKTSAFLTALLTLLISALLFNWFFKFLPFPIISAILMNIALWLIDVKLLKKLYNLEKIAFYITLLTTVLAIVVEPIYWILAWISISLLIFLRRVTKSDVNITIFRNKDFQDKEKLSNYVLNQVKWDIILMKFSWWLNYLNMEGIFSSVEKLNQKQTIVISFSHMWDLDIDWLEMLNDMVEFLHDNWITIYFSWLDTENKHLISKMEVYKIIKKENHIFESTSEILKKLLEN